MPLECLDLLGCKELNDLSPLADCRKLKQLSIPEHCKNIEFFRSLKSLEILDNTKLSFGSKQTPAEFWKVWDAKNAGAQPATSQKATTEVKLKNIDDKVMGELKSALLKANGLNELASFSYNLKPKPYLAIGGCKIKDISPLAGLDFDNLDIFKNEIESLHDGAAWKTAQGDFDQGFLQCF
jgi:hypothetical protein